MVFKFIPNLYTSFKAFETVGKKLYICIFFSIYHLLISESIKHPLVDARNQADESCFKEIHYMFH